MATPFPLFNDLYQKNEDIGAFLAGPEPSNAFGGALHRAGRRACDSYANGYPWYVELSPIGRTVIASQCQPYLDGAGYDPPDIAPPFDGGQCPGVEYEVLLAGDSGGAGNGEARRVGEGPVGGIVFGPVNQFGVQPIGVSFADGDSFTGGGQGNAPPSVTSTWQIVSINRLDGQPDDCGNPPSEISPGPNPPPDPGPYDPGDEPYSDPFGSPIIPIPPITDPFDIPIDIPDWLLPGAAGSGDPCGCRDEPGDKGEAGSPVDLAEGCASGGVPLGAVLTGVRLELISADSFVNRTELAGGDVVYRGVAYVFMGGASGVDLQPEGSTVVFPQFFDAPPSSTVWRVCVNVGYQVRVIPYFRRKVQVV